MASPAAVLSILVEANTSAANAGLAATNAELDATKANALGATAATARTSSAMRKLGTAAKWGGAALAVGFVVEAKKAVTTTQDLTKTTLTLHKNLGLGVKVSSEWGAALKARGADATKAGMAFKTFATQLSGANDGSATSIAMFKKLGLSQEDIQKAMTNTEFGLKQVADGLAALPAGADKASISGKLFGRGWQTVAPILRDGSAAMQETLDTQEKYGAFLEGKGFAQQKRLLQNIKDNKSAWLGLQVQLANFVTPALNDVSNQFQHIAKIMANPNLTKDERFTKVADIIQKDFSTALDVIVKMIPTIASRVGEQAPKIAEGLVNGFLQADIWGKLLLGSWLLGKLGGSTGIIAGGKKAGLLLGRAFAASALGSMVIEKLGLDALFGANAEGRLSSTGARAGTILGRAFGLGFITLGVFELTRWSQDKLGPLLKIPDNVFKSAHQDFGALASTMAKSLHPIIDSARRDWDALKGVFKQGTASLTGIFHGFAAGLRELMGGIRNAFHGVMGVVRTVVHFIVSAVNRAVSALGSLKDKIPDITPSLPDLPSIPSIPNPLGFQQGGNIPGPSRGDRVPLMAEGGEFMVNSRATKQYRPLLEAINGAVPRFASGGFVGMQPAIVSLAKTFLSKFGGVMSSGFRPGDPGFHGRGLAADIVPDNWGGATAYANQIGSQLLEGIHQGPPGSNVSWDSGHPVDPSFWGAATWAEHVSHIHLATQNAIKGAVGAAVAQIPNIAKHITGRGPLSGIARGAANKLSKLGNAYIDAHMPHTSFDTGTGTFPATPGGWHKVGATAEGLDGQQGAYGTVGGMGFAELLLAGENAGMHPNLEDVLGTRIPPLGKVAFKMPGSNRAAIAVKNDIGSGQPGDGHYLVDIQTGLGNAIGWNPNQDVMVKKAMRGGIVPPFAGSFGQGGVVPGPMGAPRTIIAHGGEGVGSPEVNVTLKFANGMEWLRQFVQVEIEDERRFQGNRRRMSRA